MLRKKGKLPGKCIDDEYDLEYGSNTQSLQVKSIKSGQSVAIIDDLLATGGTIQSAIRLIEKLGAKVQGCHTLIELPALGARENMNIDIYSILQY